MAQQQQTVLLVQTNVVDPLITVPVGTLDVITGSTSGITYTGTGTINDPYLATGTTTGATILFSVENTDGVFNYVVSGSSSNTTLINYNGEPVIAKTGYTAGSFNVSISDQIEFQFNVTGTTILGIYFTPNDSTVYQTDFLDLYTDIPIKLVKSFAEVQDISKRNSDYSIGLSLPGTKKNNRFFESFFDVDQVTLFFDATNRVPIKVLVDDEIYFEGYMKLNKVSVVNTKVEYDVTLFSNIGDIFGKIGNNLLKDLDFNDFQYPFNHTFSRSTVANWDNSPFQYDEPPNFFYPIIHNGYNYDGEFVQVSGSTTGSTRLYTSTIVTGATNFANLYALGVKRYRINSPEDGIVDNQLKPALNIKALINLIFKTYGYKVKSDFFNTPWFKLLYMYGYFSSDATKFSYKVPNPQVLPLSGVDIILVQTETIQYDYDCFFFPPNPIYENVLKQFDFYVVKKGTGTPCYCSEPINIVINTEFTSCSGGTPAPQSVIIPEIAANTTGTTYSYYSQRAVPCPSSCPKSYEYRVYTGQDVNASNVLISNLPLSFTPAPAETVVYFEDGDPVDFSIVIDPLHKQIDLLSSIAKKFNLVFIQDPEVANQIIIEPYNFYIGTGNIHDWSNKLSFDKGFSVEPALNYIESELIVTDKEDGDEGNRVFKNKNNRVYGQMNYNGNTDFKSQTKNIDTIFSPEFIRKWDTEGTAPNGEIKLPLGINYAASTQEQGDGSTSRTTYTYTGVKTKPKLFYYLGNYSPFLDTLGETFIATNVNTNQIYVAYSDNTSAAKFYSVPVISHTMPIGNPDSNKINNDSICNLFNSEPSSGVEPPSYNVFTENDAFLLFYQNRIDNLYDKDTRFLSGHFNLKLNDLKTLQAKDYIKINQQLFTWNKIVDYNLTNPELTKVELIQANNIVSDYPKRYFKYYYCDNPSTVYKFETDFTNPSLSGTSFGWSVNYDFNIGVLINAGITNPSGYTSSIMDVQFTINKYVPYSIYEVNETNYNTGGTGRTYDTLWNYVVYTGTGDLNLINFPQQVFNTNQSKQIMNVFTGCTDFQTKMTSITGITGSSLYHTGGAPSPYTTGITLNVYQAGYIYYETNSGGVQRYVSVGTYVIPECADCITIQGVSPIGPAGFTITTCGNTC